MELYKEEEITIEEFFKIAEDGGEFEIETPDGWQKVGCLMTNKNKQCYCLRLRDGSSVSCSNEHLVMTKRGWIKSEDLDVTSDLVETKNGFIELVAKEYLGERDTLDLEVLSDSHKYYSNGIVSHNCGKSLVAKAVAAYYGFPLLKMDFGSLFSSLQGDTEHNFREAIKLAEAQSPAVLWCDEIEKGTSGSKSSDETDGGTTARVMQSLLTWMQEKTAPVFMIGTANNHEAIAPEFLRRFDEVWFVDNPTNIGRKQIFEIQLKSRKIDMKNIDLDTLVAMTEGYNGDEIRKAINESLLFSITNKTSVISTDDIINQITDIKSLGAKKSDEIKKIRAWAGSNCRLANSPEDDVLAKAIEAANKDQGKDILV